MSEAGEVVATTFGVEAMPLIRYRTGDCAALFRAPCACGRATPRLGPIVGRKNQKLKLKGTSQFPSTLQAVLERAEGVDAFVIIARAENELFDSVEVLVHGAAPVASLREALQARSKIAPQIRQVSRAEIEALQMPPQARKRRTFVDLPTYTDKWLGLVVAWVAPWPQCLHHEPITAAITLRFELPLELRYLRAAGLPAALQVGDEGLQCW